MSEFLAFLGTMREAAWLYLCLMFLAATWLFLAERQRKGSKSSGAPETGVREASQAAEPPGERGAA